MAMYGPFRRILTSHTPSDVDGMHVAIHDSAVPMATGLGGNASFSPLFATLGLPTTTPATLDDGSIASALALAPSVVTPNGVNAQVTDLKPNFRVDMHRSNSVDYNVFLHGSAYLITPDGADKEKEARTLVRAGEVVVQRGTLHAWEAGPEGARWVTVVVAALPVEVGGKALAEVDFW